MPFLAGLLPIITAVSGVAGAGVGIGEAISGGGSQPAAPTPTTPGATPPSAQNLLQQKQLVSQQLPNVVGATSGLASPDYDALIAKILSGVTGQPGSQAAGEAATGQQFTPANSQPTNAAVSGGTVNLSDFINSSV